MIVMREGNRGQTERFQVFRRMEIGERPVRPRFSRLKFFWEFSRCPKNGCHFNQLISNSIHYSKTSNDDFANFRFTSLRHNSS